MTHLRIEQNTTGIEEVSSAVIKKLYDLVYSGTLDNTSNLLGRLHTTSTYQSYVDYLTGLYPNLYITANKYYMNFADPVVEQICSATWGDGTGCTQSDLATATRLLLSGSVFGSNTNITSFNEFLYFTNPNLLYTQNAIFENCSNLTSITYPPQFTAISARSHTSNTSLTSIDLRNTSVTEIGQGAFDHCTSLTTAYLPSTCTQLGINSFSACTSLALINTQNVTSFGGSCFEGCTSLTSIDLSSGTYIGGACFRGCTNLGLNLDLDFDLDLMNATYESNSFRGTGYRTITLHETTYHKITDFSGSGSADTFGYGMANLVKLDFSDTKLTNGPGALYSNNLLTIILPETWNSGILRGRDWSTSLLYLVILATTPPAHTYSVWDWYGSPNAAAAYVPDSAYEAYKTAWSDTPESRIKKISELPSSVTWYTKEHPLT